MITLKTMRQIATSRVIASGQSVTRLSRLSSKSSDRARISARVAQICAQEARRQWLNQLFLDRSLKAIP